MIVEKIAKICHQANKAYCEAIGDTSQADWEIAPEWQRQSAVAGVRHVQNSAEMDPSALHRNWMLEKVAAGWVYGPIKDAQKREHPCLVPYEKLPEEQRVKDALFMCIAEILS